MRKTFLIILAFFSAASFADLWQFDPWTKISLARKSVENSEKTDFLSKADKTAAMDSIAKAQGFVTDDDLRRMASHRFVVTETEKAEELLWARKLYASAIEAKYEYESKLFGRVCLAKKVVDELKNFSTSGSNKRVQTARLARAREELALAIKQKNTYVSSIYNRASRAEREYTQILSAYRLKPDDDYVAQMDNLKTFLTGDEMMELIDKALPHAMDVRLKHAREFGRAQLALEDARADVNDFEEGVRDRV